MRIKKKSIFLIFIIPIILSFAGVISLKLFISVNFNENDFKKIITDFCKDNLNKAVKFEDIYIDYLGNLIITNFDLSNSSDFNDSLSLLKSEKIIFGLDFSQLLNKNIRINNIRFLNSTIAFYKQYGRSYSDSFKNIFVFRNQLKKIKYINSDCFNIKFINNRILYKEVFKNKKLTVAFDRVKGYLKLEKGIAACDLQGEILPYRSKTISNGKFAVNGTYNIDKENFFSGKINIDNFDLSYFNDFINEYDLINYSVSGGLSSELAVISDDKNISIKGIIETNSFSLLTHSKPQYNVISSKNFNSKIDLDLIRNEKKCILNNFTFFDEYFSIILSGQYVYNDTIKIAVKSTEIDLSRISDYFTPVKDVAYKGKLKFNGDMQYDIKKSVPLINDIHIILTDFNADWFSGGIKREIVKECNARIVFAGNNLDLSLSTGILESDFILHGKTEFKNWSPLKSKTEIDISSRRVELNLFYIFMKNSLDHIFKKAYEDKKKGYEHINFLQTPAAKILTLNDISLNYTADSLLFGGNASLRKLFLKADLTKGLLQLRDFNLNGYGASYGAELYVYFNRDFPFIFSSGSIKGFDFEEFSSDYNKNIKISGTGYMEYEFELSAFRLSHLLQNTKAFINFNIYSGSVSGSELQKRLNLFLLENDYTMIDVSSINFRNLSFSLTQTGMYFYIGNFALNSDLIDYNAYGRYDYINGLNLNLYPVFYDKDKKIKRIPMKITGPLLNPELAVSKKNKLRKMKLFPDVD